MSGPLTNPKRNSLGEANRIEAAYARRDAEALEHRYSDFQIANLLRVQEFERRLLRRLPSKANTSLEEQKILEVGCGTGYWIRKFIQWGARPGNLAGVDLLTARIQMARELCPSAVTLDCREASRLDFENGSFDIVFQATVFTSILDIEMKAAVAREMLRVLKQDGVIIWYDFFVNNPRNPDVRGIGKRELQQLFPGCRIHCERITLAPPLGRLLARFSSLAYGVASGLRILSTHYLASIQKY